MAQVLLKMVVRGACRSLQLTDAALRPTTWAGRSEKRDSRVLQRVLRPKRRSRSELVTTLTEENAMAARR